MLDTRETAPGLCSGILAVAWGAGVASTHAAEHHQQATLNMCSRQKDWEEAETLNPKPIPSFSWVTLPAHNLITKQVELAVLDQSKGEPTQTNAQCYTSLYERGLCLILHTHAVPSHIPGTLNL